MAVGYQVGLLHNPYGYQQENLVAIAIFVYAIGPTDH